MSAAPGFHNHHDRRALVEAVLTKYALQLQGIFQARCGSHAEDVFQEFVFRTLMERDTLLKAIVGKNGRFRSGAGEKLIRAAFQFCIDFHRKEDARTRAYQRYLDDRLPSLAELEHRRVSTILQLAIERTEAHFLRINKPNHWKAFELRVLNPILRSTQQVDSTRAATDLEFRNNDEMHAAVGYVKRVFREKIRYLSES